VAEVGAAVDDALGCDPAYVPAAERRELVVDLHRQVERLKALELRLLYSCEDLALDEGARSAADWFAHHTKTDRQPVVCDAGLAESLEGRYRLLAEAVYAGGVGLEQARVISHALDELPPDLEPTVLRQAEEHLVGLAADFPPRLLRRLGRRVLEVVAPEVAEDHERRALEDAERRARETTFLMLRARGDGCTDLRGRIPDLMATRLTTYLQSWSAPRRAHLADRAYSPGLDPETGRRVPYTRLLGQAFCAFVENYPARRLPRHGGTATTLNLTVDLEDLTARTGTATTANGEDTSIDELLRLACTAELIPCVFDGAGQPLHLGRTRRLFSPGQRKAMALRDRECRAEGCTMPAEFCEAHHKTAAWVDGGRTDVEDGTLLCPWHHHRAHDPAYRTKYLPNGDVRYRRRT
jgi:Domain of unknown function (DUF222)